MSLNYLPLIILILIIASLIPFLITVGYIIIYAIFGDIIMRHKIIENSKKKLK